MNVNVSLHKVYQEANSTAISTQVTLLNGTQWYLTEWT